MPEARSVDQLLAQARDRFQRLDALAAWRAQRTGAVLVDIRSELDRRTEGEVPGAVPIERTVLEWRLDPRSDARLPWAAYDTRVVLVCNEGYASSLAAAVLLDLGLRSATDVVGGYRAWLEAGLPVTGLSAQSLALRRRRAAIAW